MTRHHRRSRDAVGDPVRGKPEVVFVGFEERVDPAVLEDVVLVEREIRTQAPAYDRVTDALERAVLARHRTRLRSEAEGVVLDVGAGTGANLRHFRDTTRVITAELDPRMRPAGRRQAGGRALPSRATSTRRTSRCPLDA